MDQADFDAYLSTTDKMVSDFLDDNPRARELGQAASEHGGDVLQFCQPADIRDGVLAYLQRQPRKRLRPAVLLLACGSVGGEDREKIALPAAAGIELFHTWTLVHDDLIDNDHLRRGGPTVHELISQRCSTQTTLSPALATEYGRDIAILTGDMQHGWSIACFAKCARNENVNTEVVITLIEHLQSEVLGKLIHGEVLDVQFSMDQDGDVSHLTEKQIIDMLWLKTGVLYEFAGFAGALIGKNSTNLDDKEVSALKSFCSHCGIAFQLQDDILGIVGNEDTLGKPVGSDIREGKKTVIIHEALKNATDSDRTIILGILGDRNASISDVARVAELLRDLGGIERTRQRATDYIEKALLELDILQDSKYKDLLRLWAQFMVNRTF